MEDGFDKISQRTNKSYQLFKTCFSKLSSTVRSNEKMDERLNLLREHPEARIRIDTNKLKQIIDYKDFKCHPQCSIARDEAIKGSDVDAALVVLKNEVPVNKQISFVEELRNQGFRASHHLEIQQYLDEIDKAKIRGLKPWDKEFSDLIAKQTDAENCEIKFVTVTELERMKKDMEMVKPLMIYVAGYSIK